MNDPVISVLAAAFIFLTLLVLAILVAVVGLGIRVKKLESKTADPDPDPVRTFIAESQEIQARLIAQDTERRTSADE